MVSAVIREPYGTF